MTDPDHTLCPVCSMYREIVLHARNGTTPDRATLLRWARMLTEGDAKQERSHGERLQ